MRVVAFCALAGALLGSSIAYTQGVPAKSSPPTHAKYLTKFEAQFSAADRDGDGALTKAEAEAGGLGRIVENFERIDTNKDGKVTREEIRAMIRNRISS